MFFFQGEKSKFPVLFFCVLNCKRKNNKIKMFYLQGLHHWNRSCPYSSAGKQNWPSNLNDSLQSWLSGVCRLCKYCQFLPNPRNRWWGWKSGESCRLEPLPKYCVCLGDNSSNCCSPQCWPHVSPCYDIAVRNKRKICWCEISYLKENSITYVCAGERTRTT